MLLDVKLHFRSRRRDRATMLAWTSLVIGILGLAVGCLGLLFGILSLVL